MPPQADRLNASHNVTTEAHGLAEKRASRWLLFPYDSSKEAMSVFKLNEEQGEDILVVYERMRRSLPRHTSDAAQADHSISRPQGALSSTCP